MRKFIAASLFVALISCNESEPTDEPVLDATTEADEEVGETRDIDTSIPPANAPLPEGLSSVSDDGTVSAEYDGSTDRYPHGILGDDIEASQLVVRRGEDVFTVTLDESHVFEDLQPRLYDVDGDDELEFITIRTHADLGAGIAIYKIVGDALTEYAWAEEIGTPSRWLNIAAIANLDDDEAIEIAWIQTPHVNGILKLAELGPGLIRPIAIESSYSNHALGERNLCLSALVERDGETVFFVPTQDGSQIVGFRHPLEEVDRIDLEVDFSQRLDQQTDFGSSLQNNAACVGVY